MEQNELNPTNNLIAAIDVHNKFYNLDEMAKDLYPYTENGMWDLKYCVSQEPQDSLRKAFATGYNKALEMQKEVAVAFGEWLCINKENTRGIETEDLYDDFITNIYKP